jgi:uncharacterized protein YhfF
MTDARIKEFWRRSVAATGVDGPFSAWGFGSDENPIERTELGLLVRDGPKRATTSLLSDYERDGEEMPSIGDLSVVLDGAGDPLCVIRTTHVEVRAFGDVDEGFAWVEGEGDRSLAYWREAHERFFAELGTPVNAGTPVLLETFELAWVPSAP